MIAVLNATPVVATEMQYAAQTINERGIKVTVVRQNPTTRTWDFEVTLETHTQPLSDDLTKAAVLIVDGKRHAPQSWDGAPLGGHHRKGLLRFEPIAPQPRSIELQIRLSGDVSPRNF